MGDTGLNGHTGLNGDTGLNGKDQVRCSQTSKHLYLNLSLDKAFFSFWQGRAEKVCQNVKASQTVKTII